MKVFMLSYVQDTNVEDMDFVSQQHLFMRRTSYLFGLLVVSSLMDNAINPKVFIIICEVAAGIILGAEAFFLFLLDSSKDQSQMERSEISCNTILLIFEGGIHLITAI